MSIFDPIKKRESSSGFGLGFIGSRLDQGGDPVGNFACHDLAEVVYGWLVGLHAEYAEFLVRSGSWLDQAIATHEELRFGDSPPFHLSRLHSARAMSTWMLGGASSEVDWHAARVAYAAAWGHGEAATAKEIVRHGLDDFMAYAFQCGDYQGGYEAGIKVYEMYVGNKEPSFARTMKPREFAYACCLQAARDRFDPGDLLSAGRKMLMARLEDDWLGRGHALLAAMWLKIVYWHNDSVCSPLQTVLKAYDNMPNVRRPDFV